MLVINKPSNEIPINMNNYELNQLLKYYKHQSQSKPNDNHIKNMIQTINMRLN